MRTVILSTAFALVVPTFVIAQDITQINTRTQCTLQNVFGGSTLRQDMSFLITTYYRVEGGDPRSFDVRFTPFGEEESEISSDPAVNLAHYGLHLAKAIKLHEVSDFGIDGSFYLLDENNNITDDRTSYAGVVTLSRSKEDREFFGVYRCLYEFRYNYQP